MKTLAQRKSWLKLERDLLLILTAIFLAVVAVNSSIMDYFLSAVQEQYALASFIAGIFCTSAFTVAPAAIVLARIGLQDVSPLIVSFFGGLGAMLGDAALFLFVRDVFAADLEEFLKAHKMKRFLHFMKMSKYRWFAPVVGAIIIISPLPDEFGLTLLGLSKMRLSRMLPLAFVLNFFGILGIVLFARAL
jgi:uncharacterized membrane protein YdjX (TVP38/TMEM64 family)